MAPTSCGGSARVGGWLGGVGGRGGEGGGNDDEFMAHTYYYVKEGVSSYTRPFLGGREGRREEEYKSVPLYDCAHSE